MYQPNVDVPQVSIAYSACLIQEVKRFCVRHAQKKEATYALRWTETFVVNSGGLRELKNRWRLVPVCASCLQVAFNALAVTPGVSNLTAAEFTYVLAVKKAKDMQ